MFGSGILFRSEIEISGLANPDDSSGHRQAALAMPAHDDEEVF
jgi:hypothetical protein